MLVTSKIITIDGQTQRYFLPRSHREAILGARGQYTGLLPSLSCNYESVFQCFNTELPTGVPLKSFSDYFDQLGEIERNVHTKECALQMVECEPGLKQSLGKSNYHLFSWFSILFWINLGSKYILHCAVVCLFF